MSLGETLRVSSREEWRKWLAKNHQVKREIWLIYDRTAFRERSISYREFLNDSVEEAICYGWIDSRIKRVDESKSAVRFTPRRSRDNWSKYNRARAMKMLQQGKMAKAGLALLPQEILKKISK